MHEFLWVASADDYHVTCNIWNLPCHKPKSESKAVSLFYLWGRSVMPRPVCSSSTRYLGTGLYDSRVCLHLLKAFCCCCVFFFSLSLHSMSLALCDRSTHMPLNIRILTARTLSPLNSTDLDKMKCEREWLCLHLSFFQLKVFVTPISQPHIC